jgi:hypothetical protein
MGFYQFLDDCQANTCSARIPRPGRVGPKESLEDKRQVFLHDALAGIGNYQFNSIFIARAG